MDSVTYEFSFEDPFSFSSDRDSSSAGASCGKTEPEGDDSISFSVSAATGRVWVTVHERSWSAMTAFFLRMQNAAEYSNSVESGD